MSSSRGLQAGRERFFVSRILVRTKKKGRYASTDPSLRNGPLVLADVLPNGRLSYHRTRLSTACDPAEPRHRLLLLIQGPSLSFIFSNAGRTRRFPSISRRPALFPFSYSFRLSGTSVAYAVRLASIS